MGKRKAAATDSFELFVKSSWEKTDKSEDYKEFSKTCEIKWREMTDEEKSAYTNSEKPTKTVETVPETKEDNSPVQNGTEKPRSGTKRKAENKEPKESKKKARDPTKPKKPMTPFFLFSNEHREPLKKSKPELSFKEIMKQLGTQWHSMSESAKKKYIDIYEENKRKFEEEMKAWNGQA